MTTDFLVLREVEYTFYNLSPSMNLEFYKFKIKNQKPKNKNANNFVGIRQLIKHCDTASLFCESQKFFDDSR